MKARAKELKARRATEKQADGEATCSRKSPRCRNRIAMATRLHEIISDHCAGPLAENLVRDAAYARDGKVVLLLPEPRSLQHEVCDVGLPATQRTSTKATCGRPHSREGVDRRRRGNDRRACGESGELRTESRHWPSLGRIVTRDGAFLRDENTHHRAPNYYKPWLFGILCGRHSISAFRET